MKRVVVFLLICMLVFSGCGSNQKNHTVEIIIPARYTDAFTFEDEAIAPNAFIYSEEEISPKRNKLTINAAAGYASAIVMLKLIEANEENAYEPILLTHGQSVTLDVEKGAWFKIGIAIQNPADVPIATSVNVENVEVRQ